MSGKEQLVSTPPFQFRSISYCFFQLDRIENLASLPSLTHLDLSSNQIGRMEGLDYLPNLKFLNLSCNLLSVVEGISKLRSVSTKTTIAIGQAFHRSSVILYRSRLISINLSYNQIVSLAGLKHLPSNNCLQTLQLQGNSLADMSHVITHLRSCLHLTCVVFEDGQSATNPLCSSQSKCPVVFSKHSNISTYHRSIYCHYAICRLQDVP